MMLQTALSPYLKNNLLKYFGSKLCLNVQATRLRASLEGISMHLCGQKTLTGSRHLRDCLHLDLRSVLSDQVKS